MDFSGVGEGFTLLPEGEYTCVVKKISLEDGQKGKYLLWTLIVGTGEYKGTELRHNTSFAPTALFNLRNTIIACGFDVPKDKFNVNTDLYINKVIGANIVHKTSTKDGETKTFANIKDVYRMKKVDGKWVKDVAGLDVLDAPAASYNSAPSDTDDVADIDI
jgi:hypothetical protein